MLAWILAAGRGGKFIVARYAGNMVLYYVHDPMCSWCWAFRPVWTRLRNAIQAQAPELRIVNLLGGLAPDSDVLMPPALRTEIQNHWRTIQRVVPGTGFNFDFWTDCLPRRSTWPACRAVIAAGLQGHAHDAGLREEDMILAIQQAYYLQASNPSDDTLLLQLAEDIGLDRNKFATDLHSGATISRLAREMDLARRIGARGFPSLIAGIGDAFSPLHIDYTDADTMLEQLLHL